MIALLNPKGLMSLGQSTRTHEDELVAGRSKDLVKGTLDLLVLTAISNGRSHGYEIMRFIQNTSEQVLQIEEGSLYPSLHRVEKKGLIKSEWGVSESGKRAKFYELTDLGRKELEEEVSLWVRLSSATTKVLGLDGSAQ